MKKYVTVGIALVAALATACGSSPTATNAGPRKIDAHAKTIYDQANGLTGAQREQTLKKLAEEEGKLSVYTSNSDLDDIVDAFSDKYKIDVSVYRGNSESVLQRVLQESKAGFRGVDLVETNSGEMNVINKEGLFYEYKSSLRDSVRPEGRRDGWTADRFNAFVVGFNTKKVKGKAPASIQDFVKPEWKGRVSMEVGDVDWFATMWKHLMSKGMTEAQVTDFFKRLAGNSKIVKGHTVQGELLSAGQFDAGVSVYSHTIDEKEDEGAPVTWRPKDGGPVQPVIIRPNGAGLIGSAPHPAAATLFVDFLLTEGQKIIHDDFRIGSVPVKDDPLAGLEVISVDEAELLNNAQKWDQLYAQIVQGGQKAG